MISFPKPTSLILPVLMAGGALRVAGLCASAIWYDEAYSLYLARLPLLDLIRTQEVNPPLWEMIVWIMVRLLGPNLVALRLPSLVASVGGLALAYKLTHVFNLTEWQKLAAVILLALLPYQFWMAQDGRVYATLSLLYLAAGYFALMGRWMGLTAVCGLLMYSHTTGPFYALSALALALICQRDQWRSVLMAGLAAGLSVIPWIPAYLENANRTWLNPLTLSWFVQSLVGLFFAGTLPGYFPWLGAFAILLSLVVALYISLKNGDTVIPLGLYAISPIVLLTIASLSITNIILYRTLSPLLAPLCLWLAVTLTPRRITLAAIVPYTWCVLILVGLVAWSPAQKGGGLADMAERIRAEWQPGDVIYHATGTTYLPFDFYLNEKPSYLLDEELSAGLLQTRIQNVLGISRAPLEAIPHRRAWLVWAIDPLMTEKARDRMRRYTEGASLVGAIQTWQSAPIQIYLNRVGQ